MHLRITFMAFGWFNFTLFLLGLDQACEGGMQIAE